MIPSHLGTKIELILQCAGLKNADMLSLSDPFVVVSLATQDKWKIIGRTEVVDNNLSPKFTKRIKMDFFFETVQRLKFEIYDCDDKTKLDVVGVHDFLGGVETELGSIISNRGSLTLPIQSGKGTLSISVMETGNNPMDSISFHCAGIGLKKMGFFSTDPYVRVSRLLKTGGETVLYRSESVKGNLNPTWSGVSLSVGELCGGNMDDACVKLECFNPGTMSDTSMGFECISVNTLLGGGQVPLKKPHKPANNYGSLSFRGTFLAKAHTMMDFMKAGWSLSLAVAIDFTGSNREPRDPTSLHYMDPVHPNYYVQAIMSVGNVLTSYVTDRKFAAFGFGAVTPLGPAVSPCFPLNLSPDPHVNSIEELLHVYQMALPVLRFSGPTNFGPIVTQATRIARMKPKTYTILLLITDGEIVDELDTIDALVAAADAPLSIVIVGVGHDCDFRKMEILDGDDEPLRSSTTGMVCRRDLVQFVPMRNFERGPMEALASEVLYEIPTQVMQWAKLTKIQP